MNRGVLFDPNPTRHSYAYKGNSNSNDDYDQLSGDSVSQDSDLNDRISPTDAAGTQTENVEVIGSKSVQWHTEPARLVHLVVQVFPPNNHSTSRETQSHASDAESRDISAQRV